MLLSLDVNRETYLEINDNMVINMNYYLSLKCFHVPEPSEDISCHLYQGVFKRKYFSSIVLVIFLVHNFVIVAKKIG